MQHPDRGLAERQHRDPDLPHPEGMAFYQDPVPDAGDPGRDGTGRGQSETPHVGCPGCGTGGAG